MSVLIGVPIVVIGFALRFNALLVVTIAGSRRAARAA